MTKYLLAILTLFPFSGRAQKQGMALADSLIKELHSSHYQNKVDSSKAKLYVDIATAYYSIPDSSIKYANRAVDMAEKIGWDHGIAMAYTSLCYDYSAKSDFTKAIDYGKKALAINESQGNKKDAISSLGNIANCFLAQGNYEEALEFEFKALQFAEQVKNKSLTGLVLQTLGITYDQLKDYKKSKQFYLDALRLFEQLSDRNNIATVLTNLAQVYEAGHEYTKALACVLRAKSMFEELGNQYSLMVATGAAGGCYKNLRDYPLALANYRKSLQLSRELGSIEYSASGNEGLGEIYLDMAQDTGLRASTKKGRARYVDSAIVYLEQAVSEGRKIGVSDILAQIHEKLSTAYMLAGNYKEAYEHQRASTIARDSMYSTDNRLKIAALETRREADLKNNVIELNRLATIEKRNEQVLFIGGIVMLLIAVTVVLRAHGKQKKANREKEALLKQKDILLKEIHHRVKNNLQVISTLLDLQLKEITDVHAKEAMAESTTRVKSISLIHQQLYQRDNISAIELSKFADDLVRQVMIVFKREGTEVAFHNDIPKAEFDIDTAVPLGLILNELITNSFKYAFSTPDNGFIRVATQRIDDRYQLIYQDSGPGLTAEAQHSSGLGMRMMRSLSKQLGGSFVYSSAEKKAVVTFRDIQGRKMID